MSDCQKPSCRNNPSETYKGEHGNELDLCSKHYYELVSGKKLRENNTTSTGLGVGRELTRDIDKGANGAGILDFEPSVTDLPDSLDGPETILEEARVGNAVTTPCPDCGKPMGMVSWTGEKPSCHRCQDVSPTVWMGVLDPKTGEPVGPTMNEYTDTTQNDVAIPEPQTY